VAFGNLVDTDDLTLERLVAVNLLAPLRVARAALSVLPSGGFVANVSAVVAEQPTAGMVAYSATKAGLTAADAALYREARRRQVSVIDLRPPHTETGLALRPIAGSPPRLPTGLDPEAVAARIVAAIEADEREVPAAAFAGA
jgi:short-subunit dehydrogenase